MGSFAEQVVIPAEQVVPVRKDVPMEILALIGCTVTTGVGAVYGSSRPVIDFPRMVELTLSGKLKVEQLISRRYSLDEINEGFERLGRGEVARGVIVF
jgi:Zn-dependent alcohol dehydrogenase